MEEPLPGTARARNLHEGDRARNVLKEIPAAPEAQSANARGRSRLKSKITGKFPLFRPEGRRSSLEAGPAV